MLDYWKRREKTKHKWKQRAVARLSAHWGKLNRQVTELLLLYRKDEKSIAGLITGHTKVNYDNKSGRITNIGQLIRKRWNTYYATGRLKPIEGGGGSETRTFLQRRRRIKASVGYSLSDRCFNSLINSHRWGRKGISK